MRNTTTHNQITDTAPKKQATLHDDLPELKWMPGVENTRPDHATQPQPTKPLRPLTRKQAAFVKHLIDNPKASATQAARAAYNVTTAHSAEVIASENLSKPEIMQELAKHSGTAEMTVLQVMEYSREYGSEGGRDGASYAAVALQSANSILDRLHGKATQRVESTSTVVTLSIDLTGAVPKIN